jgi:hypothetical protein
MRLSNVTGDSETYPMRDRANASDLPARRRI